LEDGKSCQIAITDGTIGRFYQSRKVSQPMLTERPGIARFRRGVIASQ
jgi:hypothetical protein